MGIAMKAGVAAALALWAGTASAQVKIEGDPKIAFVLYGAISDGGWTASQDRARQAMEEKFGVTIPYVENVAETNEAVGQALDLYLSRGYNVLIGGSYGFSDGFLAAAQANPDLAFVNIAGVSEAPNFESFYARTYEAWYLAGMAAGGVTESKTIGMVAGFPLPYVNWDINAFERGAQAIDPDIKLLVTFANTWSDPVRETQMAQAMIEQGADVLATNMTSTAVVVAAEAAGKYSVGYQNDMSAAGPNGHLTSVVFYWEHKLIPMVEAMMAGTWTSGGVPLYGLESGVVEITPPSAKVPAEVAAKIDAARQAIIAGTLSPYDGPVVAQDGTVKAAAGTRLDDDTLWGMDYLVEGVQGSMQ
jgi:basic membrane lipoprotein Med (substrate-binding protein (PBP1-ABC) superfamily)